MRSLKLGTHALPPTDVEFLRLLLRLYGRNDECHWSHSDNPPYDAILVEASSGASDAFLQSHAHRNCIRRLTGAKEALDTPDSLPRPLRALSLRNWLNEVESTLTAAPTGLSPEPASTPPQVSTPSNFSQQNHQSFREQRLLPPEGAPRFKLQRWPRQGILRGDPTRIRMATLLSRRALNERDLVNLTGLDSHQCSVFMQILHASCLLIPGPLAQTDQSNSNKPLARTPPTTQPKDHALKQSANAKPGLTRGLISGLRKRLGL